MRIAAIVEYDGSRFSGWQLQDGDRTVQGCMEEALSKVANESLRVMAAGRTDAGVHASGQVIHFDSNAKRSDYEWLRGANSNLPDDIAILWARQVDSSFHARFSATGRHYQYIILNRSVRPTYLAKRVTWEYRPLDIVPMQRAAKILIGTHDFTSFRAVQCQAKDPVKDLRRLEISRHGEFVTIDARANAFLHHMVRNIAGVLMSIGADEQPSEWVRDVLAARDRTVAGVTAPAHGLYLTALEYPEHFEIPRLSSGPELW
jgi:tRNA pseudouridine38-40 synthase